MCAGQGRSRIPPSQGRPATVVSAGARVEAQPTFRHKYPGAYDVTLKVHGTYDSAQVLLTSNASDGDPLSFSPLLLDIKTGTFGTAALQGSDFSAAATITASLDQGHILPAPGEPITIGLDAAERAALDKTGRTQMRIRWTTATDNDSVADSLGFCPGEFANTSKRPKLVVTYH